MSRKSEDRKRKRGHSSFRFFDPLQKQLLCRLKSRRNFQRRESLFLGLRFPSQFEQDAGDVQVSRRFVWRIERQQRSILSKGNLLVIGCTSQVGKDLMRLGVERINKHGSFQYLPSFLGFVQ